MLQIFMSCWGLLFVYPLWDMFHTHTLRQYHNNNKLFLCHLLSHYILIILLINQIIDFHWQNIFSFLVGYRSRVVSWFSSHYVVPTYKYMFLQFSQRSYENESLHEDYVCYSILQLKLFSLLYNLVFVASMVSTQPRTKNKSWLARNQYNVVMIYSRTVVKVY